MPESKPTINIFTTNVDINGSSKNLLDVLCDSNPVLLKQWSKKMSLLTHSDKGGLDVDFKNMSLVSDLNGLKNHFKKSLSSVNIKFSVSKEYVEYTKTRNITRTRSFDTYKLDDDLKKIFMKYFDLSDKDLSEIEKQVEATLKDFYTHLAYKKYNKYKARRELSQYSQALESLSDSVITFYNIEDESSVRCKKALVVYNAFTDDSKNIFLLYIATSLNLKNPRPTQSWGAWMSDFKTWKLASSYLLQFGAVLALITSTVAPILFGALLSDSLLGFASLPITASVLLGFALSCSLLYGLFCLEGGEYLLDWVEKYVAKCDYRFDFKPTELLDDLKTRFTHFVEEDHTRSLDNHGLFASSSQRLPSEPKELLALTWSPA